MPLSLLPLELADLFFNPLDLGFQFVAPMNQGLAQGLAILQQLGYSTAFHLSLLSHFFNSFATYKTSYSDSLLEITI